MPPNSPPPRDKTMPNDYTITRDASLIIERADDEAKTETVRMSVSSAEPVLEYIRINDAYQEAWVVLDHTADAIDTKYIAAGIKIRDGHYGDQIGLIDNPQIVDNKLGGVVRFAAGQRAAELRDDVLSGIRRDASVEARYAEDAYVMDGVKDGIPLVHITRWTPTGAALTSNPPADPTVGINRDTQPKAQGITTMPNEPESKPAAPPAPVIQATRDRNAEMKEINRLAREWSIGNDVLDAAIERDLSVEAFKAECAASLAAKVKNRVSDRDLDMSPLANPKVLKNYSIMRAIRGMAGLPGQDIGLEREVSEELARQYGSDPKGMYICPDIIMARDLTTASTGGYTVATDLLAGQFIEKLRNRMTVFAAGARKLGGLRGDIDIPKQTGAGTAYWVSEGNAPTESVQTLGQVSGKPHTVGAYTDMTRRMLLQSSLDVERFVTDDLAKVLAIEIDKQALIGTGAAGAPVGVINASGLNTAGVTAGTVTYVELLAFWSTIEADNAWADTMAWIMPPPVLAYLGGTLKTSNTSSYLADFEKRMCLGFPVHVSNHMTAKYALFGDFSQLVIGMWGGLDVTVDRAALATSGGVRVICLQDVDAIVRNGVSFCYDNIIT